MEKHSNRRNNKTEDGPGDCVDSSSTETGLLSGGKSSEVWSLLKSGSNTSARNSSSQASDSIWSSVDKPDLAWKSSGAGMTMSHQNGSLEPWSGGRSGSSAAWGGKKDGSGWGSPSASPTQNVGTEGWGMTTPVQQSWSQEARPTSGWERPEDKFGSGWKKMQGVGDNCNENKTDPAAAANVWSHLQTKPTGDSAWTAQSEEKPAASQWAPGVRGNNGSQSSWENGFPSSNPTSQTTSKSWGWAGPSPAAGPEQQPLHTTSSAASLPAAPSTWAQAAGRGLNISNSNKPTEGSFGGATASTPASGSSLSKEDLIAQLVNSKDGWGKTPIRQDTTWDLDEGSSQAACASSSTRKMPSSAVAVGGAAASSVVPESTSSHVNPGLANTGTAIWESSRDSASSASAGKLPSMAPIGSKDVGIKDRGAGANVCQKPLGGTPSSSWVSQPNEFAEGLLAPSSNSQLPSLEPNCDKSASGGGGVWNVPEPASATRCTSLPETPWNRGSKDPVWESSRAPSWSESAKSGSSSSDAPVLRHDSVSSCGGWNLEKEPSGLRESSGQSLLPRNDSGSVFDSSLSSHDQAQSWRAPGSSASSSSSLASQTSLSQGRAKLSDAKCDGIWQPQLSVSPAAAAEWTTDQADAGLSLWNPTSMTKPNAGWSDGPWSTKLKPPSSSAWNEGSDLYSATEDRKLSGFEPSNKSAQQNKPSLLQQLIDLGFHKEDVQAALLSNNMNIEQATSELLSNNNRKSADHDSSSSNGQKCHGGQGMSGSTDLSSISMPDGSSSFGHPGSILNHLATTESQVQPPNSNLPRTGLQTPSSLANLTRSVTPNLQQAQHFASGLNATGPVVPPPLSSQMSGRQPQQQQQQQQVMQNQMLQQLKMAMQSGLMSHQPPNAIPSPALLLGLRQLVQLQNVLDWLLIQHQVLIQQNRNIGLVQPGQVEQLLVNIQSVKQQIVQQKWKIGQLQKQAAPSVSWPPAADQYKDFPKDFSSLQLKDEPFNPWRVAPPPPHPPPPAAGLPLLDGIGGGLPPSSVDLGSKSHSGLPLNPPYLSDSSWSMPAWPSHSSGIAATTSSLTDAGSAGAVDSKTSGDVDGGKGAAGAAAELASSSTATLDAKQTNPSGAVLDIEEFIPGKPWQGQSTKSADEDQYVTPGSMSRGVFNMNSIIEPHILSALGRSNVGGSNPDSHWLATSLGMTGGSGVSQNLRDAAWASGGSSGNQMDHQPWAQTSFSKNTRPPPGLQQSFNRSVSWTPGAANRGDAWMPGSASNSLVLKNFPNQIDSTIVKALCQQHGPLQCFRYNPASRQVLVSYRNKEDAIQAKLALHSCVLANTPLMAEFIPDAEAARMLDQPDAMQAGAVGNAWPQMHGSGLPPKKMTEVPYWNGSSSSSFWEGYGGIWGPAAAAAGAEEHHGDLLGSQ